MLKQVLLNNNMATLSKKIEAYLENNFAFNKFGIVNISVLRASTGTEVSTEELKEQINKKYSKEMVDGKIEYIGKEK